MAPFWPHGEAVQVQLDPAGRPLAFAWRGAWHPVTHIAACWRARTGWWATEAWQEYVKLATADGLLCTLAHDLGGDRWRLVRMYD